MKVFRISAEVNYTLFLSAITRPCKCLKREKGRFYISSERARTNVALDFMYVSRNSKQIGKIAELIVQMLFSPLHAFVALLH